MTLTFMRPVQERDCSKLPNLFSVEGLLSNKVSHLQKAKFRRCVSGRWLLHLSPSQQFGPLQQRDGLCQGQWGWQWGELHHLCPCNTSKVKTLYMSVRQLETIHTEAIPPLLTQLCDRRTMRSRIWRETSFCLEFEHFWDQNYVKLIFTPRFKHFLDQQKYN